MQVHAARCCNAKNQLETFPCSLPIDGEVAKITKIVGRVANKLATSCSNGIWDTTQHNRHNGLCLGELVTDTLQTCYRKQVEWILGKLATEKLVNK